MSYISRFYEDTILNMAKQFSVLLITGPRQVGKTTTLSHIVKKHNTNISYVSLDDLSERTLALQDPELFLNTHKYPLIIDEFQYAPNLLPYIKIIVDKLKFQSLDDSTINPYGLFYLTGSQSFLSMKNVSESLAGRIGILKMNGLSTREIFNKPNEDFLPIIDRLIEQNIDSLELNIDTLFQRIYKGSFPEIWSNEQINLNNFYSSYIATYIERDIRNLINIKNEVKFMQFVSEIAARTAQEINLSDVTKEIDISISTAKEWLSILANSGLVYILHPFYTNTIKRIIKKPKIYFMDTGLACYLTRYPSSEVLLNSSYSGAIFETYVISEIVKSFNTNNRDDRWLSFYRDNNKNEIDLIYEENHKLYPTEIKKSMSPQSININSLKQLQKTKKDIEKGMIICNCTNIIPIDKNNYAYPVNKL